MEMSLIVNLKRNVPIVIDESFGYVDVFPMRRPRIREEESFTESFSRREIVAQWLGRTATEA